MKNNRLFIYALLLVSVLSLSITGRVWAWGSSGADGSRYEQLQETAVFFNNSGTTMSQGQVVVLDTSLSGASTDSTLGSYVSITRSGITGGVSDNVLAVGVVKSVTAADQTPVVVVTKGPALTTVDDSTDAVTNTTAVGTSSASSGTYGRAGGGTNLGIALEGGDGTDGDQIIIWLDPTGAD